MRVFSIAVKAGVLICLGVIATYLFLEKIDLSKLDLGRHIANGQLVFSHPELLYQNFYSYTQPEFPFVNHHWLSGLFFYWTKCIFGWNGLSFLALGLMLGTVAVSFHHGAKKSNFWITSLWMAPAILLLSDRTEIRPEMFSNLFLVIYIYLIGKFNQGKSRKTFFLLLGLQLLWVNLHIYSIFGLVLIGFSFLDQAFFQYLYQRKKEGLDFKVLVKKVFGLPTFRLLALSAVASLITPNFIRGLLYPFNILRGYGYEIVENKSVFYMEKIMVNYNITIFKFLFVLAIVVFVWSLMIEKKARIFEGLVLVFFGALGFFALRNIAVFGVIIVPFASRQSYVIWENYSKNMVFMASKNSYAKMGFAAIFLAGVFLMLVWTVSGSYLSTQGKIHQFGIGLTPHGERPGNFIQEEGLVEKRIFNNYDLGSYLDYFLAPEGKVFVDNRPEAFSVDFFEDYRKMQTDDEFWDQQLEKYGFQFIVFSHTDGTPWAIDFMEKILKDSRWKMIYFDQYAFVLARDDNENKEIVEKYATRLDKEFFGKIEEIYKESNLNGEINLVNFLSIMKENDLAEKYCRDSLKQQPKNFQITLMLGRILLATENEEKIKEAEILTKKAIDQGGKLSSVYNQLGVANARSGDMIGAERAWKKALEINSDDEWAKYYLHQMGL